MNYDSSVRSGPAILEEPETYVMLPKTNLQPSVNIVLTVNGINSTNFTLHSFGRGINKNKKKRQIPHDLYKQNNPHLVLLTVS